MSQSFKLSGVFLVFCLFLSACSVDSSDAAAEPCAKVIDIEGSSTVEPISTKAAALYAEECPDAQINVGKRGTGDGFTVFCDGNSDIADASRPIKEEEAEICSTNGIEYVELKIAFDGITVMTNPANDALTCLAFADLYALLGGQSSDFENWSDANELAEELGSTVAPYPEEKLTISAPGTESGTYDSFREIVLEDIGEEEEGEEGKFIRSFAGQADDNLIIQGIAGAETSLGWVGYSFADLNRDSVKLLEISEEPDGDCVAPTIETIADQSYPVSRDLFIYVNKEKMKSNTAIVPFVDFYLEKGYTNSVTKAQGDTGYVPLPDELLTETRAAWSEAKA